MGGILLVVSHTVQLRTTYMKNRSKSDLPAKLAQEYGINRTARALRLDYSGCTKRLRRGFPRMMSGSQRIFTLSLSLPVSGIYFLDRTQRWAGLF